jgi:hypothetical protein
MTTDRRKVLKGLGALAISGVGLPAAIVLAEEIVEEIRNLKPGQFTWHPERSPEGPVAIIVSLTDQLVHVYRNGIRIAVSTCSTGKPGHETPTGIFTILQKDKHHRSSTYDDAPMPNMNRLTWSGVALHAGNLPGYPASHGCVRLPLDFSAELFTVTHIGTPVIIAADHSDPASVVHPGLVLANYAEDEFQDSVNKLSEKSHPSDWPEDTAKAVTTVIVSRADSEIQILEDGKIVASGKATIKDPQTPLGSHVFVLEGASNAAKGLSWTAVSYDHNDANGVNGAPTDAIIRRVGGPPDVVAAMKARMHPGMVLVLTDLPAHPDTKTGEDFVVMSDGDA